MTGYSPHSLEPSHLTVSPTSYLGVLGPLVSDGMIVSPETALVMKGWLARPQPETDPLLLLKAPKCLDWNPNACLLAPCLGDERRTRLRSSCGNGVSLLLDLV